MSRRTGCSDGSVNWRLRSRRSLLLSTGEPKMARIMAGGKHMGRGSQERGAVGEMVNQWLKEKLA